MKATLQEKTSAHPDSGPSHQSPVHGAPSQITDGVAADLKHSPRVSQLSALNAAIQDSPRMSAQRQAVQGAGTRGGGLPPALQASMESLSGMRLDHVRVHYNSSRPAQLQAHAFAQGHDIHLAPGQEKHLPHEAWHVVQQARGRVRADTRMHGMAVNVDPGLEREADQMGQQALQRKVAPGAPRPAQAPSGPGIVQRRTAQQAGQLGAYAAGADGALYNIPGGYGLTHGIIYERLLAQAPDQLGVFNAYIGQIAAIAPAFIGGALHFLDKAGGLADPPGGANWANNAQRDAYNTLLTNWAELDAAHAYNFDAANRPAAVNERLVLLNQRNTLRNRAEIGLVDPFIVRLRIPQALHGAPWEIDTNFSNSALSYITRIQIGPRGVTGHITASPLAFAGVAGNIPADPAHYAFSPAHSVDEHHDVGAQIGGIAAGQTNAANHEGFDAIAKFAAEGARFVPVREMGMALKVNSRFYALDMHGQTKSLSFRLLYQNWGTWFNRAYNIDSAAVRIQVLAHGTNYNGPIDLAHDYDTDRGQPASTAAGAYENELRPVFSQIKQIKRSKFRGSAKGKKAQHLANVNRGKNQQIASLEHDVRHFRRMYPALYKRTYDSEP
ncbi:DUF4157 domain-containing protein [Massilia sp. TS11]|uniref:eCIS core domain-containing protein n=1 Tax=Massilia sp. TS11 TaxID=2908003 RepID=UPI001EDBB38B|nr:DUF4157 domain-containing protein [Massilia sp. TS11]MCG2584166.1 DUF4157 domain-containing protein [Massilia sp. TS11]